MSVANRAIIRAARFGGHLRAAEAELQGAIDEARSHSLEDVATTGELILAQLKVAHQMAADAVPLVSAMTGADGPSLLSGGDGDKPGDPPPGQ